jgi:hypothetical protein
MQNIPVLSIVLGQIPSHCGTKKHGLFTIGAMGDAPRKADGLALMGSILGEPGTVANDCHRNLWETIVTHLSINHCRDWQRSCKISDVHLVQPMLPHHQTSI